MTETIGFNPDTYGRHALIEADTDVLPKIRPEVVGRNRMQPKGGIPGIPTALALAVVLTGGGQHEQQGTFQHETPKPPPTESPFGGNVPAMSHKIPFDTNPIAGSEIAKLHSE